MVMGSDHFRALKDFFTVVATVSGDISHITAPPFMLAPQSLTEFPSYWAEHPDLFVAPSFDSCPERRMLAVLKFYLASLQRQYYVGRTVKEGLKKPLNPFLGELFFGEWTDPAGKGRVKVISEQVSHHPPTTACYLADDENGVRAEAYSTQITTFTGTSILIKQSGHAILTVDKYNETYLLPLPDVRACNLFGTPYPELNDTYKIVSSSGYTAEMRFTGSTRSPTKWLSSSERNKIDASIYKSTDPHQNSLYTIQGNWNTEFTIRAGIEGSILEVYKVNDPQRIPSLTNFVPIEKQNPWESRKAWSRVIESIQKGDIKSIVREKSKLENAQREMRKKEKIEGQKWETSFFSKIDRPDSDDVDTPFHCLMGKVAKQGQVDVEKLIGSTGIWRFDLQKSKKWSQEGSHSKPLTPFG